MVSESVRHSSDTKSVTSVTKVSLGVRHSVTPPEIVSHPPYSVYRH